MSLLLRPAVMFVVGLALGLAAAFGGARLDDERRPPLEERANDERTRRGEGPREGAGLKAPAPGGSQAEGLRVTALDVELAHVWKEADGRLPVDPDVIVDGLPTPAASLRTIHKASAGTTIVLPPGEYRSSISIEGVEGVTLYAPWGLAFVRPEKGPALVVEGTQKLKVVGLSFEPRCAQTQSCSGPAVRIDGSSGVELSRVHVRGDQRCIELGGKADLVSSGLELDEVLIDGCRTSGLEVRAQGVVVLDRVAIEDATMSLTVAEQTKLRVSRSFFSGGLSLKGTPEQRGWVEHAKTWFGTSAAVWESPGPDESAVSDGGGPGPELLPTAGATSRHQMQRQGKLTGDGWSFVPGQLERRLLLAKEGPRLANDLDDERSQAILWPLCGDRGWVDVLDAPDGAPTGRRLPRCPLSYEFGDEHPERSGVVETRTGAVQAGHVELRDTAGAARGWVPIELVRTRTTARAGDERLWLPGTFHSLAKATGHLIVRFSTDPCFGQGCDEEQDDEREFEEAIDQLPSVELPMRRGVDLRPFLRMDPITFDAMCCT